MANVYENSLELMDAHLDSVSDDVFMRDYLSVESSEGPLVKDFLTEFFLFDYGYDIEATISGSLIKAESLPEIDLNYFVEDTIEFSASSKNCDIVSTVKVNVTTYNYVHAANDNCNQMIAA